VPGDETCEKARGYGDGVEGSEVLEICGVSLGEGLGFLYGEGVEGVRVRFFLSFTVLSLCQVLVL
jgi:hypothetical protein